jgi:hypothetical protein
VPVNAENTFLLFKERRPFKLKKEYPLEQWQIISFRFIPLKTPVSFRWTVPLNRLSDLEDSAKRHRIGHVWAVRCCQLGMLLMHAWARPVEHQRVVYCWRPADYSTTVLTPRYRELGGPL